MNIFLKTLTSVLSEAAVQALTVSLLKKLAAKTDNTVDDAVVKIVEAALANRSNPVQQVLSK